MIKSMEEALKKRGFCFIEVLSPCPTGYGRKAGQKTGVDTMKYYKENSRIEHGADPTSVSIEPGGEIVVGRFVDREAPIYQDRRWHKRVIWGGMMRKELRFSGFGGQGVILMGHIMGKACIMDGKNVTLTQSYGPEARGGACSTDIIVSDENIYYPHVRRPDILIAMSRSALNTYGASLAEGGLLLVDTGLVESSSGKGIPATELAEDKIGTRLVSNIVMLGYFTAVTGVVSIESVKKSILELVPESTEEKNMEAFDLGYDEDTSD